MAGGRLLCLLSWTHRAVLLLGAGSNASISASVYTFMLLLSLCHAPLLLSPLSLHVGRHSETVHNLVAWGGAIWAFLACLGHATFHAIEAIGGATAAGALGGNAAHYWDLFGFRELPPGNERFSEGLRAIGPDVAVALVSAIFAGVWRRAHVRLTARKSVRLSADESRSAASLQHGITQDHVSTSGWAALFCCIALAISGVIAPSTSTAVFFIVYCVCLVLWAFTPRRVAAFLPPWLVVPLHVYNGASIVVWSVFQLMPDSWHAWGLQLGFVQLRRGAVHWPSYATVITLVVLFMLFACLEQWDHVSELSLHWSSARRGSTAPEPQAATHLRNVSADGVAAHPGGGGGGGSSDTTSRKRKPGPKGPRSVADRVSRGAGMAKSLLTRPLALTLQLFVLRSLKGTVGVLVCGVAVLVWVTTFPDFLALPLLLWACATAARHTLRTSYSRPSTDVAMLLMYALVKSLIDYGAIIWTIWQDGDYYANAEPSEGTQEPFGDPGMTNGFGTWSKVLGLTPVSWPVRKLGLQLGCSAVFALYYKATTLPLQRPDESAAASWVAGDAGPSPGKRTARKSVSASDDDSVLTDVDGPSDTPFLNRVRHALRRLVRDVGTVLVGMAYLVVMLVLYLVALNHADLLHGTYLAFFVVFISSPRLRSKYWSFLVVYCELVVVAQFVFHVIVVVVDPSVVNAGWARIVGIRLVDVNEAHQASIPSLFQSAFIYNVLILVFAILQWPQYMREQAGTYHQVMRSLYRRHPTVARVTRFVTVAQRHAGLWIIYGVYFGVAMVPPVSLRAFATLVIGLILLITHLSRGVWYGSVGPGKRATNRLLKSLVLYQGAVLAARYSYQFDDWARFLDSLWGRSTMKELGFEQYDTANEGSTSALYIALLDTMAQFVVTVVHVRAIDFHVEEDKGAKREAASHEKKSVDPRPLLHHPGGPRDEATEAAADEAGAAIAVDESRDDAASDLSGLSVADAEEAVAEVAGTCCATLCTALVEFISAVASVMLKSAALLVWWAISFVYFHAGKVTAITAFVAAAMTADVANSTFLVFLLIYVPAAASFSSTQLRPYEGLWAPFAFVAAMLMVAFYGFQFSPFAPGDTRHSGGSMDAQWWGLYRADQVATLAHNGTVVYEHYPVTYNRLWDVLAGPAVVVAACVLQRISHEFQAIVVRVTAARRGADRPGSAREYGAGEGLVRLMETSFVTPSLKRASGTFAGALYFHSTSLALIVAACTHLNAVSFVHILFVIAILAAQRQVHARRSLRNTFLWVLLRWALVIVIAAQFAAAVGLPPFILNGVGRDWWPVGMPPQIQYFIGVGTDVQAWQTIPDFIALTMASLAAHAWRVEARAAKEAAKQARQSRTLDLPGARHSSDSHGAPLLVSASSYVSDLGDVAESDQTGDSLSLLASLGKVARPGDDGDFTRRDARGFINWVKFAVFTTSVKVLLLAVFVFSTSDTSEDLIDLGFLCISLYMLFRPRAMLLRGPQMLRRLQMYCIAVIVVELVYQVPWIKPETVDARGYSAEIMFGLLKFSTVPVTGAAPCGAGPDHPDSNADCPTPFSLSRGMMDIIIIYGLCSLQMFVYDSPQFRYVIAYYDSEDASARRRRKQSEKHAADRRAAKLAEQKAERAASADRLRRTVMRVSKWESLMDGSPSKSLWPPPPPKEPVAEALGPDQVRVSWSAPYSPPSDDASAGDSTPVAAASPSTSSPLRHRDSFAAVDPSTFKYRVFVRNVSEDKTMFGSYDEAAVVRDGTTTAVIDGLKPSTVYCFKVSASNSAGEGVASELTPEVTTLPAPDSDDADGDDDDGDAAGVDHSRAQDTPKGPDRWEKLAFKLMFKVVDLVDPFTFDVEPVAAALRRAEAIASSRGASGLAPGAIVEESDEDRQSSEDEGEPKVHEVDPGLSTSIYRLAWYWGPQLLAQSCLSNTRMIALFVMWANAYHYASFVNGLFAIMVFCVLLVEYPRPRPILWRSTLAYTLVLLCVKFLFQLPVFCYSFDTRSSQWGYATVLGGCDRPETKLAVDHVQPVQLFGIYKFGKTYGGDGFVAGVAWDLAVLVALLAHRNTLQRQGFWSERGTSMYSTEKQASLQAVVDMQSRLALARAKQDGHRSSCCSCWRSNDAAGQRGLAMSSTVDLSGASLAAQQRSDQSALAMEAEVADVRGGADEATGVGDAVQLPVVSEASGGASESKADVSDSSSDVEEEAYTDIAVAETEAPTELTARIMGLTKKLLDGNPLKPGRDLYIYTSCLQLVTLLYLVLFSSVIGGSGGGLAQELSYNQFSGTMVLSALAQIALMLADRVAFLYRSTRFKMITQIVSVLVVHLLCFYTVPQHTAVPFSQNGALEFLYLQYSAYFLLGALQLYLGYPLLTAPVDSLTHSGYNPPMPLLFNIFSAIPFLAEMKYVLDWVCATTSLDMFMWLRLQAIANDLFVCKCQSEYLKRDADTLAGKNPQSWVWKFVFGVLTFVGLLVVVLGPALLFSGLNPTLQKNPINSIQVSFALSADNGGVYSLFKADQYHSLTSLTDSEFEELQNQMTPTGGGQVTPVKPDFLGLVQRVDMLDNPATSWTMSPPAVAQMSQHLRDAAIHNHTTASRIRASLKYTFNRAGPPTFESISGVSQIDLNTEQCLDMLAAIEAGFAVNHTEIDKRMNDTSVGKAVIVSNLYPRVLRLPATTEPQAVVASTSWPANYRTISLQLHFGRLNSTAIADGTPQAVTTEGPSEDGVQTPARLWWELQMHDEPGPGGGNGGFGGSDPGLEFYVVSDRIAPNFLTSGVGSYSVLAIYAGVVLAIGRVVRTGLGSPTERIMFDE